MRHLLAICLTHYIMCGILIMLQWYKCVSILSHMLTFHWGSVLHFIHANGRLYMLTTECGIKSSWSPIDYLRYTTKISWASEFSKWIEIFCHFCVRWVAGWGNYQNQAHISACAQPYSSISPPPWTLHYTFCEFNPNSISFLPSFLPSLV
jgi:hypothetical protein